MASFTVYCRHCSAHIPYEGQRPPFCPRCRMRLRVVITVTAPVVPVRYELTENDRRLLKRLTIAAE